MNIQRKAGLANIAAVRPLFEEWLERRNAVLTFRLTQVLSGHGCFGRYLFWNRKEETPGCRHCDHQPEDTVEHTVAECPAWAEHRRVLKVAIGDGDLSRSDLVQAKRHWEAVLSFCEAVMLAKEDSPHAPLAAGDAPGAGDRETISRSSADGEQG
nr:uncharacterized protein LOC116771467 [Danaus plexippus plexippus]